MKDKFLRILPLVFGFVFLFSLPLTWAAEKIGFVNVREIMVNSTEGKRLRKNSRKFLKKTKARFRPKKRNSKNLRKIWKNSVLS